MQITSCFKGAFHVLLWFFEVLDCCFKTYGAKYVIISSLGQQVKLSSVFMPLDVKQLQKRDF